MQSCIGHVFFLNESDSNSNSKILQQNLAISFTVVKLDAFQYNLLKKEASLYTFQNSFEAGRSLLSLVLLPLYLSPCISSPLSCKLN